MKRAATLAIFAAVSFGAATGVQAVPIIFTASLAGPEENPPNSSPGSGFARVEFDAEANTMRVEVTFESLVGVTTSAHIHCCVAPPGNVAPATPVPSFPGFPTGVSAGGYDMTFDLTLASSYNPNFLTAQGGSTTAAEAALLAGLQAGMAYLNIHTDAYPDGEIRGFLSQQVPEPATLGLLGAGLAGLAVARRPRIR